MRLIYITILLLWLNTVSCAIPSSNQTRADQYVRTNRPKSCKEIEPSSGRYDGYLVFLSEKPFNESEEVKVLRKKMTISSDQVRPQLEDYTRAFQKKEAVVHPYSVMLRIAITTAKGHPGVRICSGTAVSLDWVLTAGQCFVGSFQPHNVTVLAGVEFSNMADPSQHSKSVQIVVTDEWHVHPKCGNDTVLDHDLALVKLPKPFLRTPYVRAIKMSPIPWDHGYHGCSTTWLGLMEKGNKMFRKTSDIQVGKPCTCDPLLRTNHGPGPTSRYLCMKPTDDGSCKGNSGGGLVCEEGLAGVFSFFLDFSGVIKAGVCDQEMRYQSLGKSKIQEILKNQSPKMECGTRYTLSVFQDTHPALEWIKSTAKLRSEDSGAGLIRVRVSTLSLATMLTVFQLLNKSIL